MTEIFIKKRKIPFFHCQSVFLKTSFISALINDNDLVVKVLDSQSRGPVFKTTGGSKVDSVFHPSEVDKVSIRNFWGLSGKSKLPPRSGSSLETVEPHP